MPQLSLIPNVVQIDLRPPPFGLRSLGFSLPVGLRRLLIPDGSSARRREPNMGTLSILFLEDLQSCAVKTQDDLARAGADANLSFAVTHVETLQAALDALAHNSFDAILSDLSVPDSQGTKTVTALRKANAASPIVAFTADDSTSHMLACLRAGADDYLVKGQSPPSLVVRALLNAIERRKTRSRLRSVQAKAEAIVNAVVDAIVTFDADGIIRSVNPGVQRTFGYRPDQLIGQKLLTLAAPDQLDAFARRLDELVNSATRAPNPIPWSSEARNSSGASFPVSCVFREITDGAAVNTYCAVIRDTSEEQQRILEVREACERAEAATKAKSDFLANMSHELRTPLTAILGFAETLLVDHHSDDPNFVEAIRTILRNGEHLTGLINDVLDLAKIEAGRFVIVPEPSSPYQLTKDVLSLLEVRAKSKNLPLRVNWPDEFPNEISIDETRLRQVLINLIGNAIKFTNEGSVSVSLRYEQDPDSAGVVLWDITDTGIGMSPHACETIFEPFVQADKKTSHQFGGTGLGLAITHRLVGMMGGEVRVTSEPGVGSTFSVRFPLNETPNRIVRLKDLESSSELQAKTDELKPAEEISLQGCRILLAEDGQDNQRLISFILKKHGASVDVVENGAIAFESAMSQAADSPYDVILMDMQMPVLDGYGATAKLREAGYLGPIIALTAHAMKGAREECLAAGCNEYATKPIDRDILIRTVATLASQTPAASTLAN